MSIILLKAKCKTALVSWRMCQRNAQNSTWLERFGAPLKQRRCPLIMRSQSPLNDSSSPFRSYWLMDLKVLRSRQSRAVISWMEETKTNPNHQKTLFNFSTASIYSIQRYQQQRFSRVKRAPIHELIHSRFIFLGG